MLCSEESTFHITAGTLIFAERPHMGSMLHILPLKEFPAEFIDGLGSPGNSLAEMCWAGQAKGWMTKSIFEEYVKKVLIDDFNSRRAELDRQHPGQGFLLARGVVYLDGHTSRASVGAIQALREASIDCVVCLSHTSHVLSSLDLVVFRAYKQHLKGVRRRIRGLPAHEQRRALIEASIEAMHHACSPVTVQQAFERAGIHPLNRSLPLASRFVSKDADVAELAAQKKKRKRSGIDINCKVLTSDDVFEEVKRVEAQRAAKKKSGSATSQGN